MTGGLFIKRNFNFCVIWKYINLVIVLIFQMIQEERWLIMSIFNLCRKLGNI